MITIFSVRWFIKTTTRKSSGLLGIVDHDDIGTCWSFHGSLARKADRLFPLPDLRHSIPRDILVAGDKCHSLGKGGRHKQAIEGVSVYPRQGFKCGKIGGFYGEDDKAAGVGKIDKPRRLSVKIQLSKANLNGKLPSGSDAKIFSAGKVKDYAFRGLGYGLVAIKKPHGGMGVKQVMPHSHIVLEVLKRFVKIIRY